MCVYVYLHMHMIYIYIYVDAVLEEFTTYQAVAASFTSIVFLNDFLLFGNTFRLAVIIHFDAFNCFHYILTLLLHSCLAENTNNFLVLGRLSLFTMMLNRQ